MAIEQIGTNSPDGLTVGGTSTLPVGIHGFYAAQAAHIDEPLSTYSTTLTTTIEVVGLAAMSMAIRNIETALENYGVLSKS